MCVCACIRLYTCTGTHLDQEDGVGRRLAALCPWIGLGTQTSTHIAPAPVSSSAHRRLRLPQNDKMSREVANSVQHSPPLASQPLPSVTAKASASTTRREQHGIARHK